MGDIFDGDDQENSNVATVDNGGVPVGEGLTAAVQTAERELDRKYHTAPTVQPNINVDDIKDEIENENEEEERARHGTESLTKILKRGKERAEQKMDEIVSREISGVRKVVYNGLKAVGFQPYKREARRFLGEIRQQKENLVDTKETYKAKIDGLNGEAGLMQEYKKNDKRARVWTAIDDKIDNMGRGLSIERAKLQEDIKTYNQHLSSDPSNPKYSKLLGVAQANLGKIAEDIIQLENQQKRVGRKITSYDRKVMGSQNRKSIVEVALYEAEELVDDLCDLEEDLKLYINESDETEDLYTFFNNMGKIRKDVARGEEMVKIGTVYIGEVMTAVNKNHKTRKDKRIQSVMANTDYTDSVRERQISERRQVESVKAKYR